MRNIEDIYADIKSSYARTGESVTQAVRAVSEASGTSGVSAMPGSVQVLSDPSNPQRGRMSNWFENKLIDFIFRGQSLTLPANLYVALYSTAITEDGNAEELDGESYARVVVPRSLLAWAGTQGADSTEASSGDSGLTSNNIAIQFPVAVGEWGTALWWAILDAPTAGNMLYYGELLYPRTIYPGDTPVTFAPGGMTIWIDV